MKDNGREASGRLEIALFAVIIFIMGTLSYSRNMSWQDGVTLWKDTFGKSPGKVRPANNLARGLLERDRCQEAIVFLKMAIEKDPYYAEPHYNLGVCYTNYGRYDEALEEFREVVRIMGVLLKGHYGEIPRLTLLVASHGYMANIYATRGEYERAIEHFRRAMEYAPSSAALHYNLALTLKRAGRLDEAIEEFKKVLEIKPDDEAARWNLMMLEGAGR